MEGMLSHLRRIVDALTSLNVDYALVGALAVSLYAEPRTTRDIDIAVVLNAPELEDLVKKLESYGFRKASLLLHVDPTFRMGWRVESLKDGRLGCAVDLLSNSSGIEQEVVAGAQKVEVFPRVFIPVARLPHLIAMKVLSENGGDRLKDRLDLQGLLRAASASDLAEVKTFLTLITERGFAREKNLFAAFDQFMANSSR